MEFTTHIINKDQIKGKRMNLRESPEQFWFLSNGILETKGHGASGPTKITDPTRPKGYYLSFQPIRFNWRYTEDGIPYFDLLYPFGGYKEVAKIVWENLKNETVPKGYEVVTKDHSTNFELDNLKMVDRNEYVNYLKERRALNNSNE